MIVPDIIWKIHKNIYAFLTNNEIEPSKTYMRI